MPQLSRLVGCFVLSQYPPSRLPYCLKMIVHQCSISTDTPMCAVAQPAYAALPSSLTQVQQYVKSLHAMLCLDLIWRSTNEKN